jgi:hypothetical protein
VDPITELGLEDHPLWQRILQTARLNAYKYDSGYQAWKMTMMEIWPWQEDFRESEELAGLRQEASAYWAQSHGTSLRAMLDSGFEHVDEYLAWLDRMESRTDHITLVTYAYLAEGIVQGVLMDRYGPDGWDANSTQALHFFLSVGHGKFDPYLYKEWVELLDVYAYGDRANERPQGVNVHIDYPHFARARYRAQAPWGQDLDSTLGWLVRLCQYGMIY